MPEPFLGAERDADIPIKTIVHPTDCSGFSSDAFAHALRIAIAAKADLYPLDVAKQARRTVAATSTEDPIYRAIEEHRKAAQERYEIGRKPGRTDHELDDAIANELGALRRLFNTVPATQDGMVALFRHCQTTLPGDYTTVIDEFVEMCVSGDEDKWSPRRWARMMKLALRRIAATT